MKIGIISSFFVILFISVGISASAQQTADSVEIHGHHDHDSDHGNGFELGLGATGTYLMHDDEWAPGAHLHILYNMNKVSVGLGFETVFAAEQHMGMGVMFAYRPLHELEFSVAPSVLFVTHETSEVLFSMHFEVIYSWEITNNLHLGPVVGYGFNPEDNHFSLGVHLGIDLLNDDNH